MTLTDDDHKVARIISDLERRVSDLEEESRSAPTPNILVTVTDSVGVNDNVTAITERAMAAGEWNVTGWRTSSWGHYQRSDL